MIAISLLMLLTGTIYRTAPQINPEDGPEYPYVCDWASETFPGECLHSPVHQSDLVSVNPTKPGDPKRIKKRSASEHSELVRKHLGEMRFVSARAHGRW